LSVLAVARSHRSLILVVLCGLALRIAGVFWGLPYPIGARGTYHPDEPKIVGGAVNFPGHIRRNPDLRYPTACHYGLGIFSLPLRGLRESDPGLHFALVYLLGRLLSVLLGTAAIVLTWRLGLRMYGHGTALLAAFLLAFAMFHVTNSAFATTDVTTSFLMAIFLLVLPHALGSGGWRARLVAGAVLGLLVGAKYPGAVAVIPVGILALQRAGRENRAVGLRRRVGAACRCPAVWLMGVVALGVFLLTTPGILLHARSFVNSVDSELGRMAQVRFPRYKPRAWLNFWGQWQRAMGLPLAAASLFGLAMPWRRRAVFEWALVAMVCVLFVYFANAMKARYFIMVMPVLVLFAARFLMWLAVRPGRISRGVGRVLAACVCLYSLGYSAAGVVSRHPDTREQSAHWLERHTPEGATIGIGYTSPKYGWEWHDWMYPAIDFARRPYRDFLEGPDYVVLSSCDYEGIRQVLRSDTLRAGYEVAARSRKEWYRLAPPTPEIFAFHEKIMNGSSPYELVAIFRPRLLAPIEAPAPTIEIYRRRPERDAL